MSKSVLVIGCGIAGLATLKECLAEGLNVTCVEARDSCGGQWYYEDVELSPSTASPSSSVYQSVIIQSPRDMMSFSDFPMDPARYPYFASHKQVLQYLREYADFHNLWPHIQFSTEVTIVEPQDDGKWKTCMQRKDGSNASTAVFDAVFVCSGRHSKPHIPDFKDRDRYQGLILHSNLYRSPELFAGKKVAIIGLGNTAGDVAVELGKVSKVHLITRRGAWIVPRIIRGRPTEHLNSRLSQAIVPRWLSRFMQKKLFKEALGDIPSELVPDHEIGRGNPVINDEFLEQDIRLTILFYPVTFGSQFNIINRTTTAPTGWICIESWSPFIIRTSSFLEYSMRLARFLQSSNYKHVGQMQYLLGASTYQLYRQWTKRSDNVISGILNSLSIRIAM
ncbi:hypothetical protein ACHAPE_010222 [Trichoderma viride]